MPYKLCWKLYKSPESGVGPIMGTVEKRVFIPLPLNKALKRVRYFNSKYKKGVHFLAEVLFLQSDVPELRKIHPYFSEIVDLEQDNSKEFLNPLSFLDQNGQELLDNPAEISTPFSKKELYIPDIIDVTENDWDLAGDEVEDLTTEIV